MDQEKKTTSVVLEHSLELTQSMIREKLQRDASIDILAIEVHVIVTKSRP